MSAIQRWLDRFCYKHPRFGIPNLMLVIVVGNVLVWLMDQFSYGVSLSALLAFSPYYILHGQIWRIITFVFVPLDSNLFFLAVSLYFYYMIGSVLERIDAALFGWSVLSSLFGVFTSGLAALPGVIIPLVAILNYFIFFWDNFLQLFGRVKYQTSRQTVNFKKATKQAQQQKGYIHKCAVCGKTDTDYPNEEFRYCSKCNGYYCYCSEHIHNHVHIQ